MTYSRPGRTGSRRTGLLTSSPPGSQHPGTVVEADDAAQVMGIAIYGCEQDEAVLFHRMAPHFGVVPTITDAVVADESLDLAVGHRCISVGHKTQISASILRALHRAGVRYISTRSAGCNHIDMRYARSIGIAVENVAYSPDGVADYTLMLMLMAVRSAKSTIGRVRVHDYRLPEVRGKELRDMTVGVIGTGRIGAAVMDRLEGFGCRVLAHDRRPNRTADYVHLDELLQQSDVVTLHVPLNVDTHHLLSSRRIDQMKPSALIVNTGRGPLVDTEALLSALERGQLGGAALDVIEGEEGVFYSDHRQGPIENRWLLQLQQLPNVLISPHTAYYTDHALRDTVEATFLNCLRFERGAAWIG